MSGNNGFDPFDDFPDSPENNGEPNGNKGKDIEPKRKKKKASPGRKIAYTAVGTALSLIMIAMTCYLPLTVAPLVMISLCYNIVADKCGIGYGVLCMLASVGLGFVICIGAIGVMLIVVVVFVPYSIICVFLRKFDYSSIKYALIRIGIIAVFAALETFFVYLLGSLGVGYVDFGAIIDKVGGAFAVGYLVITLIVIVLFIAIDWMFVTFGKIIVKKLK